MSIKENYEEYCNKAKKHLSIVTKENIPWNMTWLMFFKFNLEKFYNENELNKLNNLSGKFLYYFSHLQEIFFFKFLI